MTIEVSKAKEEQNKKMKGNKKSENGITLVALIITIIILIILAAVTIKVVTDMKIIQFAIKGTEDYSKAQDKEMEDFGKIENLLTDTISNIENGNSDNPFTEEDIGKYVNYQPQGTDYTVESKYSGYTSEQFFTPDTNLKWRIWRIENDILTLIASKYTAMGGINSDGSLYLNGAQGYNNGVTLLNNICNSNYGNVSSNIKARNLNLDDLNLFSSEVEIVDSSNKLSRNITAKFPLIWNNYDKDKIKSSEPYALVETATSLSNITSGTWINGEYNLSYRMDTKHKTILNDDGYSTSGVNIWFSTRGTYNPNGSGHEKYIYFGLFGGSRYSALVYPLYEAHQSSPLTKEYSKKLCPLIEIPLSACEITPSSTEGMDFDITIK